MTEKKPTTLRSLRKEDWKEVMVETKKANKLLINIPSGNIIELNKLIYAEAKLVCQKIGISLKNSNKNLKINLDAKLGYKGR